MSIPYWWQVRYDGDKSENENLARSKHLPGAGAVNYSSKGGPRGVTLSWKQENWFPVKSYLYCPQLLCSLSFLISWKKYISKKKKEGTERRFLTGFTFQKENFLLRNHRTLWYNTCILLLFLWIIVFHLIHSDESQPSSPELLSLLENEHHTWALPLWSHPWASPPLLIYPSA